MEELSITASVYAPHANYDLNRDENDLQHYFIYKTIKEDDDEELKGECRKCGQSVSRNGSSRSSMIDHQEIFDKKASTIYKISLM